MSRVLVLAGGSPHAHDFRAIGTALAGLAAAAGHAVELAADPDAAAARLTDARSTVVDVLVVDGLWWRMEGPMYDRWRDEHAYSPPPATRAALAGFVADGGGLVALHTTPICFDDWPEWGDVVGGVWQWGRSAHPPYGPVHADVVAEHPVVAGLGASLELRDEVYGDLAIRPDVEVLATALRHPGDAPQPVVWTHRHGSGRVVFDCFGHDVESVTNRANARLVAQAIEWVARAA